MINIFSLKCWLIYSVVVGISDYNGTFGRKFQVNKTEICFSEFEKIFAGDTKNGRRGRVGIKFDLVHLI